MRYWVLHLSAAWFWLCWVGGWGKKRFVYLPRLCMKAHVYARQRCSELLFLSANIFFILHVRAREQTNENKQTFFWACIYLIASESLRKDLVRFWSICWDWIQAVCMGPQLMMEVIEFPMFFFSFSSQYVLYVCLSARQENQAPRYTRDISLNDSVMHSSVLCWWMMNTAWTTLKEITVKRER